MTFAEFYKELNPNDKIEFLDISKIEFGLYSYNVLNERDGVECKLPPVDIKTLEQYNNLQQQFINSDKIVIAFPNWNNTCPSSVVSYFSAVMSAGVTFRFTENGGEGLLKGKKALIILSSGGSYVFNNEQISCYAIEWARSVFAMAGIDEVYYSVADGIEETPEETEQIRQKAINELKDIATKF